MHYYARGEAPSLEPAWVAKSGRPVWACWVWLGRHVGTIPRAQKRSPNYIVSFDPFRLGGGGRNPYLGIFRLVLSIFWPFSFFFWNIKIIIYVPWHRFCMIQLARLWSLFIGVTNNVLLCNTHFNQEKWKYIGRGVPPPPPVLVKDQYISVFSFEGFP